MKTAHDVYAETNPAFCASVLAEFIRSFVSVKAEGPEMPVLYLTLPIALSGELAASFDGTNKNTGLSEWLRRSPQIQVGLADRINLSLGLVTEAVRFGCFTRLFVLSSAGRLSLGSKNLKSGSITPGIEETKLILKRAGRLGYWFASSGTTRSVFNAMGLTV